MRTMVFLLVALLVLATTVAWADAPSDPNLWATAAVDVPAQGDPAGTYTSTWTVSPNVADWPTGWLLVGIEFQPDGQLISFTSNTVPSGWTSLYSDGNVWLTWYANGDGTRQSLTDANGLDATAAATASWSATYTTSGAINSHNYHLMFVNAAAGPNPRGQWEVVQSSLTYDPNSPPPVVPEPTTLVLLGSGIAGLVAARRRKQAS